MTSDASLREFISVAVNDWTSANGGGFPTAYVVAVDYVDEEGASCLAVCDMENQTIQRSMGLSTYLDS